jgi:hypothetical protein
MAQAILKAHFDGKHIVLDEPFDLQPNAPLAVTVLGSPATKNDPERLAWSDLGAENLGRAYGEDEPEYTLNDLKS